VKPGLVAIVDLVWVLVFAGIGRASHGESVGPAGIVTTAWPFVVGGLVGWVLVLVVRAARTRPLGLAAGVLVWLPTVVVGMLLRAVTGAGVQTSFVVVATVVLGLFLLGWRAVTTLVRRSRVARHGARAEVEV
jgi:FtsH-binding integral membrane protein